MAHTNDVGSGKLERVSVEVAKCDIGRRQLIILLATGILTSAQ